MFEAALVPVKKMDGKDIHIQKAFLSERSGTNGLHKTDERGV